MKLRSVTVVVALVSALGQLLHAPVASAAPAASPSDAYVIDQNQPDFLFPVANLSQPDVWQTFQQSSTVISGAGIFLYPGVGESGGIRIELWNGPPKVVPGSDKGDRLAFADAEGIAGQWVDVFWAPQEATPGFTYFLAFSAMGQGNNLALAGIGDAYPNGILYSGGVAFPNLDATFRTFGPAIPEPGTSLLLCVGLAFLGTFASVRRQLRSR